MSDFDIAIVGGGLAGSAAAAMLGRTGFKTALIDPHEVYPPDFRCEKLDASQVTLLRKTGLAETVLPMGSLDDEIWVARHGRLVGKRRQHQYGILYPSLVNAVRASIPESVQRIASKASGISLSPERQRIALAGGGEVSARLIVMANGLNTALRQGLGIERDIVSANHSISIGFDLKPAGRASFDFRSLTYGPERAGDRIAYLTLFPIASGMRGNLFVYRDMRDPWLKQMRHAPRETLLAALPGLHRLLGDFEVTGFVQIRPVDLYVTKGLGLPGIVLVGDAFATSCPAAGTGVNKVLTDVERLCNVHVPAWFASQGMGEAKIAAFYADPVKIACDRHSAEKARRLRSLSTSPGFSWRAQRLVRFVGLYGILTFQDALARFGARSARSPGEPAVQTSAKSALDNRVNLALAGGSRPSPQRDSNV